MVIITGKEYVDECVPPRSIFDPPNLDNDNNNDGELSDDDGWGNTTTASSHADTLTTRDTLSTTFTGSPTSHHHYYYHHRANKKHPSQMNEVELRVQLWDAYRLARIILGTPIKSTSLRGKTILQSIRKVAEMKLELIRLQKELEMTQVFQNSQRSAASTVRMGIYKKLSHSSSYDPSLGSTSLCEELNIQIANVIVPPPQQEPRENNDNDDDDDNHNNDDTFDATTCPTPRRQTRSVPLEKRFELYKARYETLQGTHKEFMMELQEQLLAMQAQLEAVESKASKDVGAISSTSGNPSSADEKMISPGTVPLVQPKSSEPNTTISLDSPDNAAGPAKPRKSKKISRVDDAMEAVVSVAREHNVEEQSLEERQLRTVLAKPSHQVSERKSRHVESLAKERDMLHDSIQQLMKRVEESSEETKMQFEALQEQLRAGEDLSVCSAPVVDMRTQEQFHQRLRTAKTLHTLELETFKSKHTQQVVDLFGQLESYQQQVQRQNIELHKWRRKYNQLEEMVVTPGETIGVLQELQNLSPQSSLEDQQKVNAKAINILQRMVQLQARQQKQVRLMQQTRAMAKKREADTLEELEDLHLQHELLLEDTQIPPEVWERQISQQRKAFEKEIKDIFKREERRMVEIERMEVELTELAFMAVEIEDIEHDFQKEKVLYTDALEKARQQVAATATLIPILQSQVQQALVVQRKVLEELETIWQGGAEKVKERLSMRTKAPPEILLEQREAELLQVKADLLKSQQRVRDLEKEIARG